MIEKNGTERQRNQPQRPQGNMEDKQNLVRFPIVPPVPALDGSRLETGLRDAVAGWKKKSAMPRTRPLSDAEKNDRARMLEVQKRELLRADGLDEYEARMRILAEQKKKLLQEAGQ